MINGLGHMSFRHRQQSTRFERVFLEYKMKPDDTRPPPNVLCGAEDREKLSENACHPVAVTQDCVSGMDFLDPLGLRKTQKNKQY